MIFESVEFRKNIEFPILRIKNKDLQHGHYLLQDVLTGKSLVLFCWILKPDIDTHQSISIPEFLRPFYHINSPQTLFIKASQIQLKTGFSIIDLVIF